MVAILSKFKNLNEFVLHKLDKSFDFSSIIDFLKNNKTIKLKFFFPNQLPEEYSNLLDNFSKEAISLPTIPTFKVPKIWYSGRSRELWDKYDAL